MAVAMSKSIQNSWTFLDVELEKKLAVAHKEVSKLNAELSKIKESLSIERKFTADLKKGLKDK